MALTFIPGTGIQVLITTGDTTIGVTASTYSLTFGPNPLTKAVFGAATQANIPGQASGTFSASGHATNENTPTIAPLLAAAGQPIDVVLTYPAGDKHAFKWVGQFGYDASADGELDWNMSGNIDGEVTYTAVP